MIFRGEYVGDISPKVIHNYDNISDIPDVIIHYDASGLVVNTDNSYGTVDSGGNISSWKNQVSSNHAIQVLSGNQPTLVNDVVNSVNFNGTQYFDFTSTFNLYECTIIFVLKPTTTITPTTTKQGLLCSDASTRPIFGGLVLGAITSAANLETLTLTSQRNPWTNNYFLGSYITNVNITNTINKIVVKCDVGVEYYLNNIFQYSWNYFGSTGYNRVFPRSVDNYNGSIQYVGKLGCSYDNTSLFNGDIYEVIVINRPIKTYELDFINYKLNEKWGI